MSVSNEDTSNISRCVLRGYDQLIGKRHGSQNSLWYLQPPAVIPPSWQTCLVRHTSAGDRRATNLPTDCARLPACGEGVRDAFIRLCSIGIVQSCFVAGRLCDCHCTACYSHTTKTDGSKFYELSVFQIEPPFDLLQYFEFVPVSFQLRGS